jgi:thimet oligopeptidase
MAKRWTVRTVLAAAGFLACNRPVSSEVIPPKILAPPPKSFPSGTLPFDQLQPVYTPPLVTQLKPEEVESQCSEALDRAEARFVEMLGVAPALRTFDTSVKAVEQALASANEALARLSILKDVHPDVAVRRAGAACEERGAKWLAQTLGRQDLFQALQSFTERPGALDRLDPVDRRLIEVILRRFRRQGAALSEADRKFLVEARSRIAELETRFVVNLADDGTTVAATEAELRGVPPELRTRWSRDARGSFLVPVRMPDYGNVMESAKNEGLRRRLWTAFNSRQADRNLPALNEAVGLRDRAARLLGFPNHADYVEDLCMARNSRTASAFVDRIHQQLKASRANLDARMRALKVRETGARAAILEASDVPYLLHSLERRELQFDEERTRAYFPGDRVVEGMLRTYASLFGVNFVRVENALAWAPEVVQYEVHDATPDGRQLARFYLDLYPRPGKYAGASTFPITVGRVVPEGYQIPLSVLVANLTPADGKGVVRWKLSEVVLLFHEFGHVLAASLATTRYASLGAFQVPADFVETPSQMFESWVYQPEVLALISRDPVDPSATMPMPMVEQVIATRTFEAPETYSRQAMLAAFDLQLHTAGSEVNADALEHKVRAALDPFPPQDEHFAATFLHLMTGYDGAVYGYLWSRVYAADLFTRFEQEGILSPEVGRQFRDQVLAPGWSQEPAALLQRFLGRAPSEKAFLRQLGITHAPAGEGKSAPGG